MKKTLAFVYLLFATLIISAQPTTTYSGSIKGYNSGMGFKSGQLIVNNVVTGIDDMYLINIQSDGKFSVSVSLSRQQECWVTLPFFNSHIYLEPGTHLIQDFDISNTAAVKSVFKGASAAVNNDINKVRPILSDYNWDAIDVDIYELQPEQYKDYFRKMKAQKLSLIDSVAHTAGLNKTAYYLAQRDVEYNIANLLILYNTTLESAYRHKNNIPFNSKQPVSKTVIPDSSYYDFLRALKYDDASALASYNYHIFINRLMYMEPVYDQAHIEGINAVKQMLFKGKDTSDQQMKNTLKQYEGMLVGHTTLDGTLEKARPVVLKNLLGQSPTLEVDLMYLQSVARNMDRNKDTLSPAALTAMKSHVENDFLLSDIYDLNSKLKAGIQKTKSQTGYTYNQLAATTAKDSIFEKILAPYKGKVVFIDFWATWCAPCMEAIRKIAPLKEELAHRKDIVFLYITNTTSPEKGYATIMPGIKGEHYRINNDQFNVLAGMFQIVGIPHYVIVDKRGTVVNGHFLWRDTEQVKQQLTKLENE
jgi:thiol-disulfide isomerase/thioredoxin